MIHQLVLAGFENLCDTFSVQSEKYAGLSN